MFQELVPYVFLINMALWSTFSSFHVQVSAALTFACYLLHVGFISIFFFCCDVSGT